MFTARPDSRHASASASYAGRAIDVDVLQDVVREGSHIVIFIEAEVPGASRQTVEYLTDYADFDEALNAGFEIAREVIDESRRSLRLRAPTGSRASAIDHGVTFGNVVA